MANKKQEELRVKQKEKAIELLEKLGIYKPYIKAFKDKGIVTLFENFGGYYITEEDEKFIYDKIKSFEKENNAVVYAVTHEITDFGEIYDLYYIPQYKSEWKSLIDSQNGNDFVIFAYAFNKTTEWCSDFGDVVIRSFGGGIARIG